MYISWYNHATSFLFIAKLKNIGQKIAKKNLFDAIVGIETIRNFFLNLEWVKYFEQECLILIGYFRDNCILNIKRSFFGLVNLK
jgi:hypothetical protein